MAKNSWAALALSSCILTNSSPPSASPMPRRWALAKFSARASKESRWASAISWAVRAVLSMFFAVASTVYLRD